MSPAEIDAILERNDISELLRLIHDLSESNLDVDLRTSERALRALGRHPMNWVRRQAIMGLGRLAYQTRRFQAPGVIFHIVVDGLRDLDPTVAHNADMAACCIAYMHGWKFPDRARRRG
jgi:hypothetical protein